MRKYIDLHCDTISKIARCPGNGGLLKNTGQVDIECLKRGGCLLQTFACFIEKTDFNHRVFGEKFFGEESFGGECLWEAAWTYANHLLDTFWEELHKNKDSIAAAVCVSDIETNMKKRLISAMASVEEGGILNSREERLKILFERGVRLITLTWNFENCIGYPNSKNQDIMSRGLKPFGFKVLELMNKYGMIIDVSHLSDGGFWDVAANSEKTGIPFAASHSCARALKDHPRNLTDEMLKKIGNTGSVAGVNFYSAFLGDTDFSEKEAIVRHIMHMIKMAGTEAVAIGTDFDGIHGRLEINRADKIPLLFDALKKEGMSEADIDKISFQNALRLIQSVIPQ